ncbi:MAG: hypothetical protein DMF82_25925 [Acidobacteria bacterium]|nr:MAG: hypothetical protein DMF82_25925 [Acidobacteriota bacterium]
MGTKHFRFLVLGAAAAALFASSTPSEAVSIPFFGKSVCKDDKERLGHDERILRDRHQLAFDQCRAGAGGEKSRRCEDLKQQQKSEMKRFQDQRKRTLDDCKQRAENPNSTTSPKSTTNTKSTKTTKSTAKQK